MNLSKKPKDLSNLFLDMNAFFASVEQQVQPTLRGKPVVVTPYTGSTGCVIAKSYETKKYGIKTGHNIRDAKFLCPEVVVLEARPALYHIYHKELIKLLQSISPFFKILSIDEFVISLSPSEQNLIAAQNLGAKIKKEIKEKIGDWLSCSVGVGPNRFLAKVAAESQKPDGLVILPMKDLIAFYQKLTLTDLPGINHQMQSALNLRHIFTISDFYQQNLFNLNHWFGHIGKVWYYRLRGFEVDDLESKTRTVGHSHVLAPELRNMADAKRILVKLAKKVGARLRCGKFWAESVSLGIGSFSGAGWHKSCKTKLFCDNQSLLYNLLNLFNEYSKSQSAQSRPAMIFVSTFNLHKNIYQQMDIFPEIEKSKKISQALDKICDRFGPDALYPASMFGTEDFAPDRIPFGKPRYEIFN
jgi:DNA polymerase-4